MTHEEWHAHLSEVSEQYRLIRNDDVKAGVCSLAKHIHDRYDVMVRPTDYHHPSGRDISLAPDSPSNFVQIEILTTENAYKLSLKGKNDEYEAMNLDGARSMSPRTGYARMKFVGPQALDSAIQAIDRAAHHLEK